MKKKILLWFRNVYAYWCPNCPKRYRTEKKFHRHYVVCEHNRRLAITEYEDRVLKKYNRKQRRKMGLVDGKRR